MKTLNYNIAEAHKMVQEQRRLGNNVSWDGWDIVFFRPAPHAVYSKNGAFKGGRYGFENRFVVDSDGTWKVDAQNIKRSRRPRN